MHDDTLQGYEFRLPKTKIIDTNYLREQWDGTICIYSYIVILSLDCLKVKYIVSANDHDNTVSVESAITKIATIDFSACENGVIYFEQPPLDIYLISHEPMIETMAVRIRQQWNQFEHDDLCQICRFCCVRLYEKGYYLHKKLIWTTFKNEILENVRCLKKRGSVISIYDKSYESEDDKDLTLIDSLVDTDQLYEEQDRLNKESDAQIFEEVKDIIIDLIGKRQFDTLYRDYKNQHTTTASRKLMLKVKNHFATLGISRRDFNKKYH